MYLVSPVLSSIANFISLSCFLFPVSLKLINSDIVDSIWRPSLMVTGLSWLSLCGTPLLNSKFRAMWRIYTNDWCYWDSPLSILAGLLFDRLIDRMTGLLILLSFSLSLITLHSLFYRRSQLNHKSLTINHNSWIINHKSQTSALILSNSTDQSISLSLLV